MRRRIGCLIVLVVISSCIVGGRIMASASPREPAGGDLAYAVAARRYDETRRLLEAGANPEDPDDTGDTPLLNATASDQFRMANLLLDFGANPFATDSLGFTPGIYTNESRVRPGTPEGQARSRLIQRLRAAGYPWPPPNAPEVMRLRAEGEWPPQKSQKSPSQQ